MTKANVVIGANFGDEGKGLMTDYLSSKMDSPQVVLFNGGAQRGHTVGFPSGSRIVFHHFGSGTCAGAETYLSKFFLVNPIVFAQEQGVLNKYSPVVTLDPNCRITTPYDMIINQIVEEYRGRNRHGSCGLGINETTLRSEEIPLLAKDLSDPNKVKDILRGIQEYWVPQRLMKLDVVLIPPKWLKILHSERLAYNFINDCTNFLKLVSFGEIKKDKEVIFEAGQGLLLDENNRYFPYVTHSRTGLTNVLELANEAGIDELDVHYMTRWYATRHGAGPFETELKEKPSKKIEDPTNIPNIYQGTLRFGNLDVDLLKFSIQTDLAQATIPVNPSISVTCLDQCEGDMEDQEHLDKISTTGIPIGHVSYGPSRETVKSMSASTMVK